VRTYIFLYIVFSRVGRLCSLFLPACTHWGAAGSGLRGKNAPVSWRAGALQVWFPQGWPQREGPSMGDVMVHVPRRSQHGAQAQQCPPITRHNLPSSLCSCTQTAHHVCTCLTQGPGVPHQQHPAFGSDLHHTTEKGNGVFKVSRTLYQNRGPVTR